jgi:hypothetical protein
MVSVVSVYVQLSLLSLGLWGGSTSGKKHVTEEAVHFIAAREAESARKGQGSQYLFQRYTPIDLLPFTRPTPKGSITFQLGHRLASKPLVQGLWGGHFKSKAFLSFLYFFFSLFSFYWWVVILLMPALICIYAFNLNRFYSNF